MAERSSGPVKPPVIDLTARAGARPEGDKPRTRTVKKPEGEAAPAKRVRKAGA